MMYRLLLALALTSAAFSSEPQPPTVAPRMVPLAADGFEIDGHLDEPMWQDALKMELNYEVRPGDNIKPPVRTEVFMAFTEDALVVAFRCQDPDPSQIRARYNDRDLSFADDWVGVVLDTFNDERRAYELMVNPLGSQIDAINDDVGGNYDTAWNAIWKSAGHINEHGFEVEMYIPFNQLSFQTADGHQTWGIDVIRSYPREQRHHIGLFPRDRGNNSYLSQEEKVRGFEGADPGRNLQVVPTFTSARNDRLDEFGQLQKGDEENELGATVRWGITPNLTLSGTVNPDFSQVEADVVKLDINEQFALFFPESRPFFLEGGDTFNTNMNLLHTRTIANPSSALKLTGKQGRHTYGVMSARDDVTQVLLPGSTGSSSGSFDMANSAAVGRYRMDFGRNSTVGAMVTSREGDAYANQVYSMDARYRLGDSDQILMSYAYSDTKYNEEMSTYFDLQERDIQDSALNLGYRHSARNWDVRADYAEYGEDFRSDLGFRPQVGYDQAVLGGNYNWYPEQGKMFTQIRWGGDWDKTSESDGTLIEEEWETWLVLKGPFQSTANLNVGVRDRGYEGVIYDQRYENFNFEVVPSTYGSFHIGVNHGDWIDFTHNREAENLRISPSVRLNLGKHVRVNLSYNYTRLDVDGGTLFTAKVPQLRVNYRYNNRLRVRTVVQYTNIERNLDLFTEETVADVDAESEDLLGQLLFSYELNPQTVFYLGYTDIYFGEDQLSLTRSDRSFFLKLGYAWQR